MTLVIVAAKGDIKKNYCLLLFVFDDVFLKRDGTLENTYLMKILSNYHNHISIIVFEDETLQPN